MEDKDPSWKDDIAYLVLKVRQINVAETTACVGIQFVDEGKVPKISLPISTEEFVVRTSVPRPEKMEAIRHHQTRMLKQ